MCGATEGGLSLDGIDVKKEAIVQGQVLRDGAPVGTSASGHFRFFAGDGEWTLRTLAPKAEPVDNKVTASVGTVAEVLVSI